MQDCFRRYPDVYGAEIADEEAAEHEAEQLALDTPTPASDATAAPAPKTERKMAATPADTDDKPAAPATAPKAEASPSASTDAASLSSSLAGSAQDKQKDVKPAAGPVSEERGVPEKAFDATGANKTGSK